PTLFRSSGSTPRSRRRSSRRSSWQWPAASPSCRSSASPPGCGSGGAAPLWPPSAEASNESRPIDPPTDDPPLDDPPPVDPSTRGAQPMTAAVSFSNQPALPPGRARFGEHAVIACDNLVRIYKIADLEVVALQGLDLLVAPGEVHAIVVAS